jgi:hypothetical protein
MSSTSGTSNVLCPFFRTINQPRSIGCEGTDDGNTILVQFRGEPDFRRQFGAFCCRDYSACPVCAGLMGAKYRAEGEGG